MGAAAIRAFPEAREGRLHKARVAEKASDAVLRVTCTETGDSVAGGRVIQRMTETQDGRWRTRSVQHLVKCTREGSGGWQEGPCPGSAARALASRQSVRIA